MKATLTFAITQLKSYLRDPTAVFFTVLFPLIFLFVFGSVFNDDSVTFKVAIINDSNTELAKSFTEAVKHNDTLSVEDVDSLDTAKQKVQANDLDSIIELPKNFGAPTRSGQPGGTAITYYNESQPEAGQTVASIVNGIATAVNQQVTGQQPLVTVQQKATSSTGLMRFDYTISGLLGFALVSLGIFGLANQLPVLKRKGVLKRIRSTPFTRPQLITGTMLYYSVIGIASISIMVVVSILFFDFSMRGSWALFALVILLGLLMMIGLGLLIGGWAKNENQAAVIGNTVAFPLMFLSGTFFPLFLMPQWLQNISVFVPLTPVSDSLRMIIGDQATFASLAPQLGVMLVWMAAIYLLALRFFRWE